MPEVAPTKTPVRRAGRWVFEVWILERSTMLGADLVVLLVLGLLE